MKTKEARGITIISLAVTIIIMLILAGVTISSLTSENGIITKTRLAKQMSETSSEKEAIQLDIALAKMDNILDESNKYYIGEELFDRTLENGDKWNIVIDNETLKQYGTGYNHITKGTEISNYGKTQYDWIVDYNSGEIIQLSTEYTSLSYKSSLAVTDNLVLNIDATNLENENWGDIIKHGDVKYSNENRALYFDGDGDYLELTKNADFSKGFTFEFYGNLERLRYNNGNYPTKNMGIFSKMPSLNSPVRLSMRFMWASDDQICRFSDNSEIKYENEFFRSDQGGCIYTKKGLGYKENEDFYLTIVYTIYDENIQDENYDDYMKENKVDKLEYFVNGNLLGKTYYGHKGYVSGLKVWNNNNSNFFIGVCPAWEDGNLYYLKGNVYCTRLYEKALSSDEVKENVTKTQLYRLMK